MRLIQTRECDGSCCMQKPRFPHEDGRPGCVYSEDGSCQIIDGKIKAPEISPALPEMTGEEAVKFSCSSWPQNTTEGKDLGNCCWGWVDE